MADHPDDRETEARILSAAHAVFMRRGTAGARMQEIADEAGVNKALLHYYFRSKERLAEAVFESAARRLFPPVFGIMASNEPLEAKVEQAVRHYLGTLRGSPFLPGYVLSELHHHPGRIERLVAGLTGAPAGGFARPILARLDEQIQERVRAGTMRPIHPEQFVANLIALCIFPFAAQPLLKEAFGWGDEGFAAFLETRRSTLAGFFLNGLRP